GASAGNRVEGNRIGVDATGLVGLGAPYGVLVIGAAGTRLGGAAAEAGNVIAATTVAVYIAYPGAVGNLVQGDRIGIGSDGATPPPSRNLAAAGGRGGAAVARMGAAA